MDELLTGFDGQKFKDIFNALLNEDRYMALADFESYAGGAKEGSKALSDQKSWNRMSLVNTACAGRFAADRAIREYAGNIWHASPVPLFKTSAPEH